MLFKSVLPVVAFAVVVSLGSCADDKPKINEATALTSGENATPDAPAAGLDDANLSSIPAQPVYFGFDDYTLNGESQSKLTVVAEGLKANKAAVLQIEGHCDERGTVEYNLALGERRAQSVKSFLTQMGVEGTRLSTISYGEEKPVDSARSEDAWQKNRRAELSVTKN